MGFFNNKDKYSAAYNNVSCNRYGLYLIERPDIPTAEQRILEYEILGKNGKMYCDTGLVEDKEITIKIGFFGDREHWTSKYRAIKEWLKTERSVELPFNTLQFADDTQYYYRVKHIVLETTEREACDIGNADVRLILDGYNYKRQGFIWENIEENGYFEIDGNAAPILEITRTDEGTPDDMIIIEVKNGEIKDGAFVRNKGFNVICELGEKIYIDMSTPLILCENLFTGAITEGFNRITGDFSTLTDGGVITWNSNVEQTGTVVKVQPLYRER